MARDWESVIRFWAKPPGVTEQTMMENAERMIRAAINDSPLFAGRRMSVFAQGSYKNLTHIPGESDVDICVLFQDISFSDWSFVDPAGNTDATVRARLEAEAGLGPPVEIYADRRAEVGAALAAKFREPGAVTRGDKAFDIRKNSYRVDADVVTVFEHRRWFRTNGKLWWVSGTQFYSDGGDAIVNWPAQQNENGVEMNKATGGRFKDLVRVVKNLQVEMEAAGERAAVGIPSFLIESLVYNVPNDKFGSTAYVDDLREVLFFLWQGSQTDAGPCAKWIEESGNKWLFWPDQAWNRAQVNAFLLAAWNYVGYPTS